MFSGEVNGGMSKYQTLSFRVGSQLSGSRVDAAGVGGKEGNDENLAENRQYE